MTEAWHLTDHVCRVCFGRVLKRTCDDGKVIVRCADCGLECESAERSICSCGIRLKGGRDAKIRCQRQDKPSPEFPAEVVAVEVK